MLRCTPAAAATLQEVRRQNAIPEDYGVRLFPAPAPESEGEVGLGIDFTDQPAEGDHVSEQHGTTVMVAPEINDELADLTLDVVPDPSENGSEAPQLVLRRDDES